MKTKLLSILALVALLGCDNGIKPASLDEIAQATCLLHDGDAQGVLVGFNDTPTERVILLTARHVATYKNAPRNEVHIKVGGRHPMTLKNSRNRWYTTAEGNDSAWIELEDEEIAQLRSNDALHYIAISEIPNMAKGNCIPGTGTNGYEKILSSGTSSTSKVTLFFRAERLDGEAQHILYTNGVFKSRIDPSQKPTISKFVEVIAPKSTPEGESGGAAFTSVTVQGRKYWLLSGIIIGGNEIHRNKCAVVPVDDALSDMRYPIRQLFE